jgi:lipoprotein-releasing system permease protein
MINSLPLFVGLRYVRARSHKFFVSFITWVSLLCVCLGVTALIVILSVMNGLEGELRERLLALSSHARVFATPGSQAPDWESLAATLRSAPKVTDVSPFMEVEALAVRKPEMLPVRLRGIDPAREADSGRLGREVLQGRLEDLLPGTERVFISRNLSMTLELAFGDTLTVLVPTTDANGVLEPRLREFTVAGVFNSTVQDYDSLLIAAIDDVRALLPNADTRMSLHVNFTDALQAAEDARALAGGLPQGVVLRDWTEDHASYFRAIRIEKTMVAIILMLIVAVAAFNVVSTLVMVVTDKQADIAILRTLGATPRSIMQVFMVQGVVIGVLGTLLGVAGGVALALNIDVVVPFLERLLKIQFLSKEVYFISELPSDLHAADVVAITAVALVLALVATVYPSWRASRVRPAEALRYE